MSFFVGMEKNVKQRIRIEKAEDIRKGDIVINVTRGEHHDSRQGIIDCRAESYGTAAFWAFWGEDSNRLWFNFTSKSSTGTYEVYREVDENTNLNEFISFLESKNAKIEVGGYKFSPKEMVVWMGAAPELEKSIELLKQHGFVVTKGDA